MTARLLLCRCLIFFIYTFAIVPAPASNDEDPLQRLPTFESRKLALAELINNTTGLEDVGDYERLVLLLNRIGELHLRLYDFDSALAVAKKVHGIAERFRDTDKAPILVDTVNFIANVHLTRNDDKQALPFVTDALTLSRKINYRAGEARCYMQLALVYYAKSKIPLAETNNDNALAIWRELNNKRAEAETLVRQGETYLRANKQQQSADALTQAATIWRDLNEHTWLATTLIDQTFLAMRQGQWQSALAFLNQAEPYVTDKQAEPYLAGQVAMGYGLVYEVYGQLETSRRYLQESLIHFRDGSHDREAAIDAGNKLSRVIASLGDFTAAQEQMKQNLRAAEDLDRDLFKGLCHEDFGRIWLAAGSYEEARREFLLAIDNYATAGEARPLARAQMYLGEAEFLVGNMSAAANVYRSALRFFKNKDVLDYTNEASVQFGLGKVALRQGQFTQAEEHLERSIELTRRLRENAFSRDLRSSFLDSVHDRFETYVELLMERNAKAPNAQLEIQAFEASESGRALALLDSLYDHQRELRNPSDPALLVEEKRLQNDEQQLTDQQAELVSRNASKKEKQKVDNDLENVKARYETLQARINSSAKFTNLLRPPINYENIRQQVIDSDTSLLEYCLGDKNSFAWLITKNGIESYKLADKGTINNAAEELTKLLQKPSVDSADEKQLQTAINEVSRLVLEPFSDKLRTRRLIVVADGGLQYVPFQVLKAFPTASEPLVAQFDIIDAPSAAALASVRQERKQRAPATKMVIGFGDAVFSTDYSPNSRTTGDTTERGSVALPPLFNARRELNAISNLAGSDSAFYMEYDATRQNLLHVDLSQFRVLHIVTHGIVNDSRPELSGLYFSLVDSDDRPLNGFVGLGDIYKMHAPVDLVVLSACRTAIGKESRGEGLIGLTRGFMYAGASSVLATLWSVDDAASAELMKYFYTFLLQDGLTPPAALREAQNKIRSQAKWRSPYYWAGFTIHGEYELNLKSSPRNASRRLEATVGAALTLLLVAPVYWFLRRRSRARKP
jgi:CHAT domain-containing protein